MSVSIELTEWQMSDQCIMRNEKLEFENCIGFQNVSRERPHLESILVAL